MGVFGELLRVVKACYVPNLEVADDHGYLVAVRERVARGREAAGWAALLPRVTRERVAL